jgi:hypothetical protein
VRIAGVWENFRLVWSHDGVSRMRDTRRGQNTVAYYVQIEISRLRVVITVIRKCKRNGAITRKRSVLSRFRIGPRRILNLSSAHKIARPPVFTCLPSSQDVRQRCSDLFPVRVGPSDRGEAPRREGPRDLRLQRGVQPEEKEGLRRERVHVPQRVPRHLSGKKRKPLSMHADRHRPSLPTHPSSLSESFCTRGSPLRSLGPARVATRTRRTKASTRPARLTLLP